MATPTEPERRLALQGAKNFRDLGGYVGADGRRVRWRMLFRSDALGALTDADVALLREIGIASVFDLRSASERERHGLGALHAHGVPHTHVPLMREVGGGPAPQPAEAEAGRRGLRYLTWVQEAGPALAELFGALADGDHYPAVFHCMGGKDRTGMLAALVLSALGVDEDTVAADYALTSEYLSWTEADLERMAREYKAEFTPELLAAEPATIREMLQGLCQRYGSVAGFLSHCSITDAQLARLRDRLLEP